MTNATMQRKVRVGGVRKAEAPRTMTFVASDETVDRAQDVIRQDGWDLSAFKQNPVILFGHEYGMPPVGRATRAEVVGGEGERRLEVDVEFAPKDVYPFADTVYRLVDGGFLNTVSVGFIPHKVEAPKEDEEEESASADGAEGKGKKPRKPRRYFLKQELLEVSVVPVPANPNAVRLGVEKGLVTEDEASAFEAAVQKWCAEAKGAASVALDASREQEEYEAFMADASRDAVPNPLGGTRLREFLRTVSREHWGKTIARLAEEEKILDETEDNWRFRLRDPEEFVRLRTFPIKEDKPRVNAVGGPLKSDPDGGVKVQSLLFPKEDGWTRDSVMEWVEAHADDMKSQGEPKTAIPYSSHGDLGKADMAAEWDADAAVGRIRAWAGGPDPDAIDFEKYAQGFAWREPDAISEKRLTGFKLPHHDVGGSALVHHWRGAVAAMGALLGARDGADVPESERESVYAHLKAEYSAFDREAPEFRAYTAEEWADMGEGTEKAMTEERMRAVVREVVSEVLGETEKRILEAVGKVAGKGAEQDGGTPGARPKGSDGGLYRALLDDVKQVAGVFRKGA